VKRKWGEKRTENVGGKRALSLSVGKRKGEAKLLTARRANLVPEDGETHSKKGRGEEHLSEMISLTGPYYTR